MKKHANYVVASLAILTMSVVANGSIISYVTPVGSTSGGNPVDAEATFTTSANTIQIVLQDLQVNPTSVGQLLSDLSFTLSTGQTCGTLTSSSGTELTVARGGAFTDGGTVSTGWSLSSNCGGLELDVLGSPVAPAHLIIGPPGGSTYSNANGSIAGNKPHNPFLAQSATFTLNVPGVTANSTVNSAEFSFGTSSGSDVQGVLVSPTPEPATLAFLAIGSLALLRRRRRRSA